MMTDPTEPRPSEAAISAARDAYENKGLGDRVEAALAEAYAVDVAPLVADIARLRQELDEANECLPIAHMVGFEKGKDAGREEIARLTKARDSYRAAEEELAAALQKIGMALGSSDEWTDRATMIADVLERVDASRRQTAELAEALRAVKTWAEQRCPCENDEPKICPLCGADKDNSRDICLSAEKTLPASVYATIIAALSRLDAKEDTQS